MFESITDRGWHNLCETSSDGLGGSLEEVAQVFATQRQKISGLTINNYSLKNKGVIIIYTIYLESGIVAFVVFERQTIEVFRWCSFSFVFNFSENEAFAGEVLILGDISHLILLSLVKVSDLFFPLIIKKSNFNEDSLENKHSRLDN